MNKNLAALLHNHDAAGRARKRIVAMEGSSRSGKTYSIIEYLLHCCRDLPGLIVTCYRHDGTTHERSTIRDLHALLPLVLPKERPSWNGQAKRLTFANGSVLEFTGSQDPAKLHGPALDIAWFNECMEIRLDAYNQVSMRTRAQVILDWNPSLSHHWVYDQVLKRDDVEYVHSTYRDNPHLPRAQVAEIEKYDPSRPENVRRGTADKWMWDVYGLGRRGRREGVIYTHWEIVDTWPPRDLCQRWGYGVDFGFSDDPAAVIECAIYQGDLWVREAVYERGLVVGRSASMPTAPSMVGRMEDARLDKQRARLHCDGARPDLIRELCMAGYQAGPAAKGEGSILAGVNLLRGMRWFVHRASIGIQSELEQYCWKRLKTTGEWLDEPEDRNNHAMDAIRYWTMGEVQSHLAMAQRQRGSYIADSVVSRQPERRR